MISRHPRRSDGSHVPWLQCTILLVTLPLTPLAGLACGEPRAHAGKYNRWATANPYLVAPVVAAYDYDIYTEPLDAKRTDDSYAIDVPADFQGSLTLASLGSGVNSSQVLVDSNETTGQEYLLRRIEIRLPGQQPAGLSQVLERDMEAMLIHEGADGSWLNIILPFASSASFASVLSMVEDSELPTDTGAETVLHNNFGLNINAALEGATFYHFWDVLPTMCAPPSAQIGPDVHTRVLMRSDALPMQATVHDALVKALFNAPKQMARNVSATTWMMGSCSVQNGCANATIPSIANRSQLAEVQVLLNQAVQEVRQRKDLATSARMVMVACLRFMEKYPQLNHSCHEGNYTAYRAAVDDVEAASDEMRQLHGLADKMQAHITEADAVVWDADAPAGSVTLFSSGAASGARTSLKKGEGEQVRDIPLVAEGHAARTTAYISSDGMVVMGDDHVIDLSSAGDCRALKSSPVDIRTAFNEHPTEVVGENLSPVRFKFMDHCSGCHIRLHNLGNRLRIVPSKKQSSIMGRSPLHKRLSMRPLGAVVLNGVMKGVSYVDIHVPGQHALDGVVSSAELHLVHVPGGMQPLTAVAIRLAVGRDDEHNAWLDGLLGDFQDDTQVASQSSAMDLPAPTLASAHVSLGLGIAERFFSYHGTQTSPPCRPAQWYVIEEVGTISRRQLQTLQRMISSTSPALFKARTVSVGPGTVRRGFHVDLQPLPSKGGLRGIKLRVL